MRSKAILIVFYCVLGFDFIHYIYNIKHTLLLTFKPSINAVLHV